MGEKKAVTAELEAIRTVVDALKDLDEQAQKRVLKYTLDMLSIDLDSSVAETASFLSIPPPSLSSSNVSNQAQGDGSPNVKDIKTLKGEKKPTSANEMTALVAYYLAEHAPYDERRTEITSEDIEKYFKQAGFPLPKQLRSALPNALNAGYLDKATFGKYRLNPVGYNLVAHKLPAGQPHSGVPRKSSRKKSTSKRK